MATVSRVTGPSIGLEALPGPMITARLSPNYADGMVRGVQDLGGAVAGIMQQEQDKADVAQVMEAQRKLGDWERSWFDPSNPDSVPMQKGRSALGLNEKIAPEFDRVQSELMSGLHSERARNLFLQHSVSQRESMMDRVTSHTVREVEMYQAAEFKTGLEMGAEDATRAGVEGRHDDQERIIQGKLNDIAMYGYAQGLPPETIIQQSREFTSQVYGGTADAYLAQGSPEQAKSVLERHAADIDVKTTAILMQKLEPQLIDEQVNTLLDGGTIVPAPAIGADQTVDEVWPRLIHRESGGKQSAVSSKGAVGAAQIMPATGPVAARYAGMAWDPDRFKNDRAYNEALGKAYLNAQMTQFGSMPLALAAYNAGPGRLTGFTQNGKYVQGWLERFGDPRKGEISMDEFIAKIPIKETREYVQAISGKTQPAPAPTAAGAVVESGQTAQSAVIQLGEPMTLEQQLAQVRGYPPKLRKELEAGIIHRQQIRESDRQDMERNTQEGIYGTVNSMDPTGDWRKALTPAQRAYADRHNLSPGLDQLVANRRAGVPQVTPPAVANALDSLIYMAASGNPEAVKKLTAINPYDLKLQWSDKDRSRVATTILALKKGNGRGLAAAASEAEINQTITHFGTQNLGITKEQLKTDVDAQARFNAFDNQVRLYVSEYSAKNGGKKPSYKELQDYADGLTFKVPARVTVEDGGFMFFDKAEDTKVAAPNLRYDQIPAEHRKSAVDLLLKTYPGSKPTDFTQQQVQTTYLMMVRRGKIQ